MFRTALIAALGLAVAAPVVAADPPGAPDAEGMRAKLLAMDTDHDGKWSKAEWLAGGRRERGFDMMDADHDGFLTADELKAGMAKMRAMREAKGN